MQSQGYILNEKKKECQSLKLLNMVTELVELNECCLCKSTIANKTMTKTWPLEKNYSPIKNAATELQIICNVCKMEE